MLSVSSASSCLFELARKLLKPSFFQCLREQSQVSGLAQILQIDRHDFCLTWTNNRRCCAAKRKVFNVSSVPFRLKFSVSP